MEYEFDKEIDLLLRKAQRETLVSQDINAHIDADEISLFAENALANKTRMRVTEHLADCAKCRKILSNVIIFNSEESSEIVHTKVPETVVAEAAIPWYRKLFIFPQLAYTMGGLTVLLAGMIGYVVLQSYNESKDTSIAQMEKSVERPRRAGGADSDGETVTTETYSTNTVSNVAVPTPASNSAATTANAPAMNVAGKSNVPMSAANSTAAAPPALPKKDQALAETPAKPSDLSDITTVDTAKNESDAKNKEAKSESESPAEIAGRTRQQDYSRNSINQTQITPDSQNVRNNRQIQNLPQTAPMSIQQDGVQTAQGVAKSRSADDKKEESEKTKSIGGKGFVYRDGVWYDKSYRQQKTVNVSRNSDDYKKLDSGLKSIADSLGGTVVIIWKSKAYRIQ